MRQLLGTTPFIRLPYTSKPLEFAYAIFKILSKPKDYTLTTKTSAFLSFGRKTSAKKLSDKNVTVSDKISA